MAADDGDRYEAAARKVRRLTKDDIESFKQLRVSIRFFSEETGDFWLVPEHTDEERREITPEELADLLVKLDEEKK
jgi:hypothetical protein